jgi:leucyl-tRNA synthetase
VEHAVLHLLYSRFWHKVLYDIGVVSTKEPFQKLVNQGMILGDNGEKMSKSRGNVVNPDTVIAEWGADSLRLYEMFMGPLEQVKPWQTNGIVGVHRFLKRAWRMAIGDDGQISKFVKDAQPSSVDKALHIMIKRVSEDTEQMRFNTAISAMMEFVNTVYKESAVTKKSLESFVLALAPYAPHTAEEIWSTLGHQNTLTYEAWPRFDPALTIENNITLAIMVNGKNRGTISVAKDIQKDAVIEQVKGLENITKYLDGKTIRKEIYVPGKIINFVVS